MDDWRDLARRQVPFDEWPEEAKLSAVAAHTAASTVTYPTAEDWEVFDLQRPYQDDFANFVMTISKTFFGPVYGAFESGTLRYQTAAGTSSQWEAVVVIPSSKYLVEGEIIFELFGPLGQVDLKRVPLVDEKARYTTVNLPAAQYLFRARYEPLDSKWTISASMAYLDAA